MSADPSTKYTHGPWERVEGFAEPGHPIYAAGQRVFRIAQKRAPRQMDFIKVALVDSDRAWDDARLIAAAPDLLDSIREALGVLDLADAYGLYEPGSLGDADVKDCREQLRRAHHAATGKWATPLELEMGASEELTRAEYEPAAGSTTPEVVGEATPSLVGSGSTSSSKAEAQ